MAAVLVILFESIVCTLQRGVSLFTTAAPDTITMVLTSSCADFVLITDPTGLVLLFDIWNYICVRIFTVLDAFPHST